MQERPILFSSPMVRAILDGRKTQTRRVVKPQPPADVTSAGVISSPDKDIDGEWSWLTGSPGDSDSWDLVGDDLRCPYGVPGDRLWVREAWRALSEFDGLKPRDLPEGSPLLFEASGEKLDWQWGRYRHARFMPRWASRITLEVTDVRVERLRDISHKETDAQAEGVDYSEREPPFPCWRAGPGFDYQPTACDAFRDLWDSINGKTYPWKDNPWVWVVEFKCAQPPAQGGE